MKAMVTKNKWWLLTGVLLAAILLFTFTSRKQNIDFNSQVKPILNKKCITCHGGVRRKAGFSLLFRTDALAKTDSGRPAIIPYDPEHSEMIKRLTSKDPDERMPYKHAPLTDEEISILKNWIKQGLPWGEHWAYAPVKKPEVPKPAGSFFGLFSSPDAGFIKNEVDNFIVQKWEPEKLHASPQADKPTLLRRVSLDLIGMPAPDNLAKEFLEDKSDSSYEKFVDALLHSPHFGEKWAAMWLDLARYADTKGYERDDSRNIWRYRDWLINAFNSDMPYNRFLTEQLAGDLMPDHSDAQLIATAFHRNTMTNDEGGTDNEEFRTAAVIDRVNTTWEALMGTTFGCVQCHSHPYDPFRHEEYYKFLAFFNNSRDEDTYADYPLLREYKIDDSLSVEHVAEWVTRQSSKARGEETRLLLKTWQPAINSIRTDHFTNCELVDTKWLTFRNHAQARLPHVDLSGKDLLMYRYQAWKNNGTWTIHLDSVNGPILKTIRIDTTKGGNWKIAEVDISPVTGFHDLYFTYTNPLLTKPNDSGMQFDWFCFTQQLPGRDNREYPAIKKEFDRLLSLDVPGTPVMIENPKELLRTSHIFERGNWLVKGKEVQPDVPGSMNPFPSTAPRNRLGMAMWLTSDQNPLTARTMVNRIWEQIFGNGIAETLEDMGTQGIPPTHRELLDWLSYTFMHDDQWSVKKLLREIVLSGTYRQQSNTTKELQEKDPANKFLARGPRVRLSAEEVRDQALVVSGSFSGKMFGPSVMPWQPKGIWLSPYNGLEWHLSDREDRYRRAVYTYWKRTAPYPSMMTFDGSAHEVCTARRIRTNTPLQALTTLNDEMYLDLARNFAYRMQQAGGKDIRTCISNGYEMALDKPIDEPRLKVFTGLYADAFTRLKNDRIKTCDLVGVMDEHNNPETAALVVVANAMLNLDEMVTKN